MARADELKLVASTLAYQRTVGADNRIAQLEKENAELIKENEKMKKGLGCETCQIHLEYMRLNDKIMELEKQVKDLEWQLQEVVKDNDNYQAENKRLEQENHLLGKRCNQLLKDKGNLIDELAKWKDEWQEQVQKAIDEGYARTLQTIQLTKAKDFLNEFMRISKASDEDFEHDYSELIGEAEQFIKEIEK